MTYKAEKKIIDLIKPFVPMRVLRDVLITLNEYDTEAKRNIIEYQRKNRSVAVPQPANPCTTGG